MILRITLLLLFAGFIFSASAQENVEDTAPVTAWTTGGSIGMDLSQLILLNPKIGGGENKLGIGGLNTLFAKYKQDKSMWESDGTLQLAIQKLGSSDNPFTKNLDLLRLNSKYGYSLAEKWYGAFLFGFESLLLNTYDDLALSSTGSNKLQAAFLSPATLMLAPGIDFVKDENLSIFISPFGYKSTLVLNDEIAALGVHGNPWTSANDYENVKHELGANIKAKYKHLLLEKLTYGGELNLFYNYLNEEHGVEFMDVIWINDFGVEIFKGLSLNLLVDMRWDRDLASVLDQGIVPDGLEEFRKWMITEAFVVKYNYVFK